MFNVELTARGFVQKNNRELLWYVGRGKVDKTLICLLCVLLESPNQEQLSREAFRSFIFDIDSAKSLMECAATCTSNYYIAVSRKRNFQKWATA